LTTSSIARINLFLHGVEDFRIEREDTLRHPVFRDRDQLSKFDVVIANPPFSLKNWGFENWANDPFGRSFAGVPPKRYGDLAWVQHMIVSMAYPSGRMGVVLPHGALFRGGAESRIRKHIVDSDLLDGVIGLARTVIELYEKYSDVEGLSSIVSTAQIKENQYNLNISRYVKKPRANEKIDLKATMEELEQAYAEFSRSEDQMRSILKEAKLL
jgi:type I restriction enzyme M protein